MELSYLKRIAGTRWDGGVVEVLTKLDSCSLSSDSARRDQDRSGGQWCCWIGLDWES